MIRRDGRFGDSSTAASPPGRSEIAEGGEREKADGAAQERHWAFAEVGIMT